MQEPLRRDYSAGGRRGGPLRTPTPREVAARGMTQRFLCTPDLPTSPCSIPARNQLADSLRQRLPGPKETGVAWSQGSDQVHGLITHCTAGARLGCRARTTTAGAQVLAEAPPERSVPTRGKKVSGILATPTSPSQERTRTFSLERTAAQPAERDPAEAVRTPGARDPGQRPAVANHTAPRAGEAGGRGQPWSDGVHGQ